MRRSGTLATAYATNIIWHTFGGEGW